MAVYNVNQNRQFYVVTGIPTATDGVAPLTNAGELSMHEVNAEGENQVFFKHKGIGGLSRTDIIDINKICQVKLTSADTMQTEVKRAVVTLSSDVNGGKPISGQDYILRIQINNYLSPGDASVLIKVGAVRATPDMDAEKFYEKMADVLTKSFARESSPEPLLKFEKTSEGLEIQENGGRPWRLGVLSEEPVNFEVIPTTVRYQGEDVIWANVNEEGVVPKVGTGFFKNNTRQIADLEYFCQGERGDLFRNMGWPNNIDVKYMVNETSPGYDVLDIHYYYSGPGVQEHKSEKTLTFVSDFSGELKKITDWLSEKGVVITVR